MTDSASGPPTFLEIWLRALFPGEHTYVEIAASRHAKAGTAYAWIFLTSFLQFSVYILLQGSYILGLLHLAGFARELQLTLVSTWTLALFGGFVCAAVAVALFAVSSGMIQLTVKLLGGQSTYGGLAYTLGAIEAPSAVLSCSFGLINAIPIFGFCIGTPIALIALFVLRNTVLLQIQAIREIYGFAWLRALEVALIVLAVVFTAIALCLASGIVTIRGSR